jgi:effector-binding domain-containing protein
MPDFKIIEVEERPYLYVDRTCSMDPAEISRTMGDAFSHVFGFMGERKIKPAEPPISVYYTYDPETIAFRAGFLVSKQDARKAAGDVKAGVTPAGRVVHFVHTGPYSTLRASYGEMMSWLEKEGLKLGVPTWEVYIDDPDRTPEDKLRTEVFVALA